MTTSVYSSPPRPNVGFDLIDLGDPLLHNRTTSHFRWITHPDDFVEIPRVFNNEEFWFFWTAKEAVYKCLLSYIKFIPKEIPIQFSKSEESKSLFRSLHGIYGMVSKQGETIFACCGFGLEYPDPVILHMQNASQRSYYSPQIKRHFQKKYNIDVTINYEKPSPAITYGNESLAAFSLSHHHRLFGFLYSF